MLGFLTALTAKVAGLGTAVKAVVATTAAMTMGIAGGVAGILPVPGSHADSGVVAQGTTQQPTPALSAGAEALTPATTETGPQAPSGTSTTRPVTPTSTRSSTSAAAPTDVTSATRKAVAKAASPAIAAPPAVPGCVANLIPTGGNLPDPVQLAAQLPACILSVVTASLPLDAIQSVIGSANLPVDVSRCLSSVVSSVPTFAGGNLSGLPQLLSACLPKGSFPGMGSGSFPGGSFPGMGSGSFPGLGSFPGMGSGSFPGVG